MNVHDYIKFTAVATMVALTVYAARREPKEPLVLVTMVTEMVVMTKAHAEDVRVEPKAPEHKPTLVERAKEAVHAALPKRESPSRTVAADGSGAKWTFPYSCRTVKWAAATFSEETLETMRKKAGERLPTAFEKQQISECIAGRFK